MTERTFFFKKHPIVTMVILNLLLLVFFDWGIKQAYLLTQKNKHDPLNDLPKVRVSHEIYHHALKPMMDTKELWGNVVYPIKTNSLAFKDRSTREVPLVPKGKRIVFLGDSMTEAIGIEYEKTFVGLIEDQLAKENIEVLNASTASYCPILYYLKTKDLIEKVGLHFDTLIVTIDVSDAADEFLYEINAEGKAVERPDPLNEINGWQQIVTSLKNWGDDHIEHNFVVLGIIWRNVRIQFERSQLGKICDLRARRTDIRENWTHRDDYYEQYIKAGLDRGAANMDLLKQLCDKHGIRLIVGINIHPTQLKYDLSKCHHRIYWKQWADKNSIPFFDIYKAFEGEKDYDKVIKEEFIDGDIHYNEKGCQRIANEFMRYWKSISH